MSVEVSASDVIKLMVQFLQENNLHKSASALWEESQICIDFVEDRTGLEAAIKAGQWERVLEVLSKVSLPLNTSAALHELIFRELTEGGDLETARALLRQGTPLQRLKELDMKHYLSLEGLLSRASTVGLPEQTAERIHSRRLDTARLIMESLADVKPAKLLSLIQSAILWEQQAGRIPKDAKSLDLMAMHAPRTGTNPIKGRSGFPKLCIASRPFACEAAVFSRDGSFVVLGTAVGEIHIWDHRLGSPFPPKAVPWTLASVSGGVSFLGFSRDGKTLLVGTTEPDVVAVDASTGNCLFKLPSAHKDAVSSVDMSAASGLLLTAGFDEVVRLWGTRSKGVLKEFRGHVGFIESVLWVVEPSEECAGAFASAGSDGFLKIWDVELNACTVSARPPSANELAIPSLKQVLALDGRRLLVVSSECLHIFSLEKGDFIHRIPLPSSAKGAVISAAVTKDFFILLTDTGKFVGFGCDAPHPVLFVTDTESSEPINFAIHPTLERTVSFDTEGVIKFWE